MSPGAAGAPPRGPGSDGTRAASAPVAAGDPPVPVVLGELQALSNALLAEFDAFCRAHELPYLLDAGTLLGAYRGGGWIPWDDDVDVLMRREHYDRLRAAWRTGGGIDGTWLADPVEDPGAMSVVPRIRLLASDLTFEERYGIRMPERQGICLDIFILDRAPRRLLPLWHGSSRTVQGVLAFRATTPARVRATTAGGLGRLAAQGAYVLSHVIPRSLLQRLYRGLAAAGRSSANDVWFALNHTSATRHVPLPSSAIEASRVAFEGREYPAPNPPEYLSLHFGPGFMEPPPEAQRVGHGFEGATVRWAELPGWARDSVEAADTPSEGRPAGAGGCPQVP